MCCSTGGTSPHAFVVIVVLFVPYRTVATLKSPSPAPGMPSRPPHATRFVVPVRMAVLSTASTRTV